MGLVHAGEPWGLDLPQVPGGAFHAITAGTAWMRTPGRADVRLMLPGPAQTRILCASYRYDPAVTTPLFSLLPEVVHVPAGVGGAMLDDTLRLLSSELARRQLATATVRDRLIDVLLIQLLRAWVITEPATPSVSWS